MTTTNNVFSFHTLGRDVQSAAETKEGTLYNSARLALKHWKGFPYADKLSADSVAGFKSGVIARFAESHTVVHYSVTNKNGTKVKRLSLRDKSQSGDIQIEPEKAFSLTKADLKALNDSPSPNANAIYKATADCRAMLQRVASDALNDLCEAGMTPEQLQKVEESRKRKGRGANKPFSDRVRKSLEGLSATAKAQHNAGNLPFTYLEWQAAVQQFLTTLGLVK